MIMRNVKFILVIVLINSMFIGCSNNDDDIITVPPRDRGEQQIIDGDSLVNYLETHYIDFIALTNNPNPRIEDIVIIELPEDGILPDPDQNRLLIDITERKSIILEDTDYDYYILIVREGNGNESPNVSDNVLANFQGSLQDGEVFDSTINPTIFDLTTTVPGFSLSFLDFNTAESFSVNSDGTVNFSNPGVGVVFMPSGLGFFDQIRPGIPSFSNVLFKFELFQTDVLDHDNDGIPSYIEDLNQDLIVINDDTDGDTLPNYLDADDDGDGVLTINEDINNDGDPTNDDADMDGTPNYLDTDSTESNEDS